MTEQMTNMPKTYDPTTVETRLYEKWESEGLFKPADHKPEGAKPFCIVMPPPNITGQLHMGHAMDNTMPDILVRYHRMLGDDTGMAVLLITHDLGVVSETADRVVVMYCGQVVEEAEVRTLFDHPMHPYTLGLLKSIPRLEDDDAKRLYMIKGTVPNPLEMPPGCHFSDRCDSCMDICRTKVPDLVDVDGHKVRCFLYEDAQGNVADDSLLEKAVAAASEAARDDDPDLDALDSFTPAVEQAKADTDKEVAQ